MAELHESWRNENYMNWDRKCASEFTKLDDDCKTVSFERPLSNSRIGWDVYDGMKGDRPFEKKKMTFVQVEITFPPLKGRSNKESLMFGLGTKHTTVNLTSTDSGTKADGFSHLLRNTGTYLGEVNPWLPFTQSFEKKESYTLGLLYNDFEKTIGFSLNNEYIGMASNPVHIGRPYYLIIYCARNRQFTAKLKLCATTDNRNMYSPIANWPTNELTGRPIETWEKEADSHHRRCQAMANPNKEWLWQKKENGRLVETDTLSSAANPDIGYDTFIGSRRLVADTVLHVWNIGIHMPRLDEDFMIGVSEKGMGPKRVLLADPHAAGLSGDWWSINPDLWRTGRGKPINKMEMGLRSAMTSQEITVVFNKTEGRLVFYLFGKIMGAAIEDVFAEELYPFIVLRGLRIRATLNWTVKIPLSNEKSRRYFKEAFSPRQRKS